MRDREREERRGEERRQIRERERKLGIKLSFKDQVGHILKVLNLIGINSNLRVV